MTSPDLDIIRQKRDQAPKQQNKKHIQKSMQKQSKRMGRSTKKIIGALLHREDSKFRINDQQKQIGSGRRRIHKSTSFQNIFNSRVSNYIFWFMLCM
jgi:hypothetical protein